MKKLLLFTTSLLLSLTLIAQETPPSGLKSVNAQFYINLTDSSIWHQKGAPYGWERLARYSDILNSLQLGGSGTGNILVYGSNGKAYAPTGFQYNASSNNYIFTKPLQMNAQITVNNVTKLQNTVHLSYSLPIYKGSHLSINGDTLSIDTVRYAPLLGATNYIQNNTSITPQLASFNINENGYLGDSLKTYSERIRGGLSVGDSSITSQDTSFYYGYSVTAGLNATAPSLRWTTIVSSKTNVFEINRGVSGTTLQLVTAGDSSLQDRMTNMPVYRKTFKYLFIEEGINDCDLGLSLTTYGPEYITILNYLKITKGWPANKIIVLTPSIIGMNTYGKNNTNLLPFAAANIAAAKATGVQYVDVNKYMLQFGQKGLIVSGSDSIHTTNYGHAIEAQAILDRIGRGRFNEGLDVNGGYFELGNNAITYGTINFGAQLYIGNHTFLKINDNASPSFQVGIDYNSTNGQTSFYGRGSANTVFGSGVAGAITPATSAFYFDGFNNYYPIGKYAAPISYGNAFTGNILLAVDGGSSSVRGGVGYTSSSGQTSIFGRVGINGGLLLGLGDYSTLNTTTASAFIDNLGYFNFNGIRGTFDFGNYAGDAIRFAGDIAGLGYQTSTGFTTLFGRNDVFDGLLFTTGQTSSTASVSNSAGGIVQNNFFFNGAPTAPTAPPLTRSTQIATTAYTDAAVTAAAGMANPMTSLGDIIYGATGGTPVRLGGNVTTGTYFLSSTGDGSNASAPTYFNLFGTANTWTPTQAFSGGISVSTSPINFSNSGFVGSLQTGMLSASRTWTLPDVSGPLAVNPMTSVGDIIYGGSGGIPSRIAGNTTTVKNFFVQTGTGSTSAAPGWSPLSAFDIPSIHGNSTTTGTATTAVTVTIGTTMANTNYYVGISPQDLLTAVNYYISAKTTTTFTVTFVSALTGSINFDWSVMP